MTNRLALLAHWSVRQILNRVNSVQFSYVALLVSVFRLLENAVLLHLSTSSLFVSSDDELKHRLLNITLNVRLLTMGTVVPVT